MSDELKKRIFTTLALLVVARTLSYLPLPGINLAVLAEFAPTASAGSSFDIGIFPQATIGAFGILPYLAASGIIILIFYFRQFRGGVDERDVKIEFYTFSLAGVIVLVQSYGITVFLENLAPLPNGELVVAAPGWGFRLMIMLAHSAGFFLLVWLAHLISRKGIGNGVCLFTLLMLVDTASSALVNQWSKLKMNQLDEDARLQIVFVILPFLMISFLAVIALVGAKWQLPVKRTKRFDGSRSSFQLRINGVGIIGLFVAQSLLFVPAAIATILPAKFPGKSLLQNFSDMGVLYGLVFGILIFVATYFWTAWAYRPSGLQHILNTFHTASEDSSVPRQNEFDRTLAVVTLPLAIVLPLIAGGFIWLAHKSIFFTVFGPATLFPVIAISIDLSRQFKIHRQMAAAFINDKTDFICEECHAGVSDDDQFCPSCGNILEENHCCDIHPGASASARCVVCQKKLCENCYILTMGRYLCEEHSEIEIIEGWATALITTTRLEAELHKKQLEKLDIPAMVFSNTIEPQYGTLGLFEINPVTPFMVYRELGGGRIRIMVPTYDLIRVEEYFAKKETV